VAIAHDRHWLAHTNDKGKIVLTDARGAAAARLLDGHKDSCLALRFAPDGRMLFAAGWDRHVRGWDAATGKLRHDWQDDGEPRNTLVCSPDGRWLLSAMANVHYGKPDTTFRVWDILANRLVHTIALDGFPQAFAFSDDGRLLAAAGGTPGPLGPSDPNTPGQITLFDTATGRQLARIVGHPRTVAAVAFSPDDLVIVKGGPEERRRLLDQGAGRLRALATAERQEFERILRQRTGLLKAAPSSQRALATLDVWDESFARAGAVLVRNRLSVLERLRPEVVRRYRAVAGSAAEVALEYRAAWMEGPPGGEEEIREALAAALAKARPRDLERGVSTAGPHRDDLEVLLDGMDARVFASQGEQRSLALSLRMAERDLVAESRGEDPILLLDDIFSELDDARREHLVAMVAGSGQTIATATTAAGWPLTVERTLAVEAGMVVPVGPMGMTGD